MAGRDDDKDEHPIFALGAVLLGLCVLGFLVWLVASHRIVFHSVRPSLFVGALWKLVPSEYAHLQWEKLVGSATIFYQRPVNVSLVAWGSFVSVAFQPLMAVVMLTYLAGFAFIRKTRLMRRFNAKMLMMQATTNFTGIAPVVAIRKQIAKNKHPLWRRQVTPEEVFRNYRVPQASPSGVRAMTLASPGAPMVSARRFDREVARAYFTGISRVESDGRLVSAMLGRQIVNVPIDARHAKTICFSDRMSPEGKALLALWGAVAFGGKEGRDEFCRYRDALNRSAFGTKDGIANLTLAQPLYDKYRKHPSINKLFAVHHWEHTALFALLALAQKKGRFTTAEVLWLRPLNRVMYFSLNSRGSYTPHTEAASTFAQFAFESACARLGRLPLTFTDKGVLQHVLYVDKAIEGLELEWQRWEESTDDENDDWWVRADLWSRSNATVNSAFERASASVPSAPMPGDAAKSNDFDSKSGSIAPASATLSRLTPDLDSLFAGTSS